VSDFPDIPAGYGVPLVDLSTYLLPEPTMVALSATYVRFLDTDGNPLVGKLDEIADIVVEDL
jgi:hypothetical protein